ncbi:ubiquitin carboxyl-terminal hydrolase 32 isoform X2 [Lampetra fluviatilis]
MGAKESKLGFLAYEDALKRVTDDELKRLRDAFKRSCGLAYMNQLCFVREVLGEGVPSKVAEVIYNSFGGSSKGLSFKELVVGLVLLTRGRDEEKIKYIFSLCANESGSYVSREGLEGLLQACETQPLAETVRQCFRESERANYERFKQWLLANKELLILSRWLLASTVSVTLTDDSDTPTFYQTLAGVTHLEESDIIDLEKRYWLLKAQSRTGHFDLETFAPLVSPPLPPSLTEGIFNAFDENRDNHIDFKEISCGLSACCRGPLAERQKFCFKVFDRDRDGLLSWLELHHMVEALLTVWCGNRTELCPEMNMETAAVVNAILQMHDTNQEKSLSLEDYQIWSVTSTLAHEFLTLLFQVCHIVLGLRPASPGEEGQIIRGWLEREHRQGFRPGQLWYLISMQWWQQWKDYVRYDTKPVVSEPLSVSCSRGRSAARAWENGDAPPHSTPSGSSLDSVSLASEASESMGFPQPLTPATESCFLTHSQSLSPDGATTRCFGNSVPSSASQPIVPQQACLSVGPQKPGVIDNVPLINSDAVKVPTLTAEGGRLKCSPPLMWGQDYEIVPDPVWRSLSHWYGYNIVLPRTVIPQVNGRPLELELYPVCIYLLRHQQPPTSARPIHNSMFGGVASAPAPPKRYLAYTACFSTMLSVRQIHEFLAQRLRLRQEDLRLWLIKDENNLTLLDDDEQTIKSLRIEDNQQILIEVRNKDMSWPEEMSSLANRKSLERSKLVPTEKGATGLSNLGNTCFMNSSIQCVSNTRQLTQYFLSGMHLYELNRTNPLGMKGHMAKCYGDLINELWSGTQKNVAPLKLRWTIGKYAPRFNGFQQQDSQELLAFLLDGLHEDLNRVHDKPYVELKDSDGRPDHEVATEAWENHLLRNKSIVVDLFHGQLKSQVRCKMCDHVSVRFDPFNFLSLPLPMDSSMHVEITVIRLDGSVPVRYGLRLGVEDKYSGLKQQLSELSSLQPQQILLAEVFSSNIRNFPDDNQKVRSGATSYLCAFEIPVLSGDPASTSPTDTHSTPIGEERAASDALAPADVGCLRKAKSDSCMPSSSSSSGCSPAGGAGGVAKSASNGLTNGHLAQSCRPEQLGGVQPSGYAIAVHRKMMRMEVYFLSSHKNRPSLFGMPLIVPCAAGTQHCHLYDLVWGQVARLVSPLPPQEASNHAQDCDDSLGYQYPFTLSAVQKDGVTCAWCPWYRFCRGCKIECNTVVFVGSSGVYIAIDWDPTALHLRYQTAQERVCLEHESVGESRRAQTEPISLNSCLQAFTKEEELGEDELYYCSKCRAHRLASKKLDIWRLPPSLIIHLKRFQFVNGRWIKSHKIVKFPRRGLDPSAFLAPRRDPEDARAVSPATADAAATTAMFATAAAAIAALKEVQHDTGGGAAAAPGANLYGGLDAVHSSSSSDSGFAVGAKASGGGSNSPSPSSGGSRTGSPVGSPRFGTKARSHLRPKQFAPGKGPLRLARGKKKDGLAAGSRENLQGADSAAPCKGQAPLHGGDSKASSTDAVSAAGGGGGGGFVGGAGEDAFSLVLPNDQNPNGDSGQQCLPSTESGRQGCVRVCESGPGPECSDSSRLRDAFCRAGSGASLEVVSTCGGGGGGSRSDHGDNAEGSVQVAGEVCLERSSSETLEGGSGEPLGAAVSFPDTLDTSSSGFSSKEDLSAQDGVKEDCAGDMWPTSVASDRLPNGAPGIGTIALEPSASADRSDCETETSEDSDETKPIYDLYAISCHSGIMGGGHYVTYARNPNTKWYCYNDSSCKEVHEDEIDTDSAYLLFYERRGLDGRAFLPTLHGRCPVDTSSLDEDFESDYRKYCVIQ